MSGKRYLAPELNNKGKAVKDDQGNLIPKWYEPGEAGYTNPTYE